MAADAHKLPDLMTVDEFFAWPGDGSGCVWELVDGIPRAQDAASDRHGTITGNLSGMIWQHLKATRPTCRLIVNPGIAPAVMSNWNHRIPDLGVSCTPAGPEERRTPRAILLIEVLSESNSGETWGNVGLYCTVPSVIEILIVDPRQIAAWVLRRGEDGTWPPNPEVVSADAVVLDCIDLTIAMDAIYRGTYLAIGDPESA